MITKTNTSLQTKDFISIGIFSLIYFVIAFSIGGIAQMTPVTFPFMPMIVALFTGSIFMLYTAKIPKRGAISILGILSGILLFVTGMFWMMSAFFAVLGFVADFIVSSGHSGSFKRRLIAYCVFALSPMGAYVPMAVMPEQFDKFMRKKGDFSSFAEVINAIGVNKWAIPVMMLGTIACALIGGFIGKKLLKNILKRQGLYK